MGYILVKAPTKEGKMTSKERAAYLKDKAEREARREKIRREQMGIPELAEEQPKVRRGEPGEGTDVATRQSMADVRSLQPSEAYIPPTEQGGDDDDYEEDETMQLTPQAKSIRERLMQEALEAARVDTTGRRKGKGVVGEVDLGDSRYQEVKQSATEEGQRRGLSGDALDEYVRNQMKQITSARGAKTGLTSRKIRGAYQDMYVDEYGDVHGHVDDFDTRPAGAKVERRWDADARLGEERPSRVERSTNINLAIDRKNRKKMREDIERMGLQAREQASAVRETSFEPSQDANTPHVQHMEAQGRAGADIPEPSGQHSAMFGGTKKKPKYHAPIKQVMQRLLADNPDEIAQMLDMPHLGEYAKQLDDDENLKLTGKGDKQGMQEGVGGLNERGEHLLDVLGEQMVRALGGGQHKDVLNRLGLVMAPGHERMMPGSAAFGGPEEIDAHMGTFDKEIQDRNLGIFAEDESHRRFARAAGVPEHLVDEFAEQASDLTLAGHPGASARDRVLLDLIQDGVIPETALQSGDEGMQDYKDLTEFRPEGTFVPTPEPDLIEEGMPTDEYAPTTYRGTYTDPVTGQEVPFTEGAPEAKFPTPSKRFTQTETERLREEKRAFEAKQAAARRRAAQQVQSEERAAMAPDTYANITAGMDEEQKRMFYESMGIEAPPDERTLADFAAPVAQEPLAQDAPYDPTRETPEEFDMRRRGRTAADEQRQVGPARGEPQTRPLPFAEDIPEFDEDDEISTMAVSGFSLGSQLLKAILDDMLK